MRFSVRVPASSANLGSGFDTLAVALSLFTTVVVESTDDGYIFDGGPDLAGGENLIEQGMRLAAEMAGLPLPPCRVAVSSDIPVARGLGSSATALIAGLLAGNHLLGNHLSQQQIFELATSIEGHGDNVSASLFGGVTLSLICADRVICRQIPLDGALQVVLFVPDAFGLTADARAVVPLTVPRQDAVANLGRCALLLMALMQGDFALLGEAMRDTLHQPYRSALFPHVGPMIKAAVEHGAFGACLSGAGPSVLAFVDPERAACVAEALNDEAFSRAVAGTAIVLDIVMGGATITDAV
ncbi:MAG TPA: homoserine kinase [Nitrolancea sp.]